MLAKSCLPLAFLFILPLLGAACGGSTAKTSQSAGGRTIHGTGFSFAVPGGWAETRLPHGVSARPGSAEGVLVSVSTFALAKPYAPRLFDSAARELDRVARDLAAESHGTLTESTTTTVDGRRVRAYRFTARPAQGARYDERIGFVLDGRREFQLLCRAPAGAGDPDGACALLFSSFSAA